MVVVVGDDLGKDGASRQWAKAGEDMGVNVGNDMGNDDGRVDGGRQWG